MLAPGTAEQPAAAGSGARRLLLRCAVTALFAGGLWLAGSTLASAAEHPEQGADEPATTRQVPDRQASETESNGLLGGVTRTLSSTVRHVPVVGDAVAPPPEPAAHPSAPTDTEHDTSSSSDPILPIHIGPQANNAGTEDGSGIHSGEATASGSYTAPAPAAEPEPEPAQHHSTAEAPPPPSPAPEQPKAPTKATTKAPAAAPSSPASAPSADPGITKTDTAADSPGRPGEHERPAPLPANQGAPSANSGHSGAGGDRGGNSGMFAVATARDSLAVDPTGTTARAAGVRYASADRIRPSVAPD